VHRRRGARARHPRFALAHPLSSTFACQLLKNFTKPILLELYSSKSKYNILLVAKHCLFWQFPCFFKPLQDLSVNCIVVSVIRQPAHGATVLRVPTEHNHHASPCPASLPMHSISALAAAKGSIRAPRAEVDLPRQSLRHHTCMRKLNGVLAVPQRWTGSSSTTRRMTRRSTSTAWAARRAARAARAARCSCCCPRSSASSPSSRSATSRRSPGACACIGKSLCRSIDMIHALPNFGLPIVRSAVVACSGCRSALPHEGTTQVLSRPSAWYHDCVAS